MEIKADSPQRCDLQELLNYWNSALKETLTDDFGGSASFTENSTYKV